MKKKRKSLIEAELAMEKFLVRVGYTGKFKGKCVNEIPDYRVKSTLPKTSDIIPGKTPKKEENVYTGNEIMGVVVTHKSNLMPIRKDNKQAAVDAAQMRRN
jgi:hypothetical protein